MKTKSIARLKALVWKEFSIFIRRRDADWRGYVKCVTCGIQKHWTQVDAGHFISGRHNIVLYDERNCHAQCKRCNNQLKGNWPRYYEYMKQRYGLKVIEELIRLDRTIKSWNPVELQTLLLHYKELNKEYGL